MTAIKKFSAPERTFTRNRGCYSCKSYENGELSRKQWAAHKFRLLGALEGAAPMTRLGDMEAGAPVLATKTNDPRLNQIQQMDKAIHLGVIGMCLKGCRPASLGGPEGDFVEHRFLCDRWDGRQGSSIATSGQALDKLSDELADIAIDRANRKS
jgi:hypothetical protein